MENEVQKLEMLLQFKHRYGDMINKDLLSIKYCQSDQIAFVEMIFKDKPEAVNAINLDFIDDEVDDKAFKPCNDIIDNADKLIDLGDYSLINCIDNLFNIEDEKKISDEFHASLKFLST